MFSKITMSGHLDNVLLMFRPEGIFASRLASDRLGAICYFSPSYFHQYRVDKPFQTMFDKSVSIFKGYDASHQTKGEYGSIRIKDDRIHFVNSMGAEWTYGWVEEYMTQMPEVFDYVDN